MGAVVFALLILCASAGIASAEGAAAPRPIGAARSSVEELSKRSAYTAAVADCESMWDRGTHMTKKEWSVTCRRVQKRLEQLEIR